MLVVTEFALSLVLMIAAGLLLRSFWDVFNVGLGFNPQNVMAVRTRLPVPNDPKADIYRTAAQEAVLVREMLRRGRTLPGVEEAAVGSIDSVPLNHRRNLNQVIFEGRDLRGSDPTLVEASTVSPEYFHLLGIPLVHGRLFTDQDNENAPQVAIVNDAFARTWWPNDNPVGKRVKLSGLVQPLPGLLWLVSSPMRALNRSRKRMFRRFTNACFKERMMNLFSSCAGGWTPPQFLKKCACRCSRSTPNFLSLGDDSARRGVGVSLAKAILDGNGSAVRLDCIVACGPWNLWNHFVSGQRAHPRNWHSPRAGSNKDEDSGNDSAPGIGACHCRRRGGIGRRIDCVALDGRFALRRNSHRSSDVIGVTLVLTAAALAASYIPAMRAMRVDPLMALRYE